MGRVAVVFNLIERVNEMSSNSELSESFIKLCAEMSSKTPCFGDRVLVSAGHIGFGHYWERIEMCVVECADTSYRCKFKEGSEDHGEECYPDGMWIHQALITDVLGKPKP